MAVAQFAREYTTIRRAEGWGSDDGAYYRSLPYRDLTGRFPGIWCIRARSFDTLIRSVIEPLEGEPPRARLQVLDVGAGSGWLANRLAERGHSVLAVDLLDDPLDGLGARKHYTARFRPLLAEYDRLPLVADRVDVAVFNASFHYSRDYAATLRETLRVLRARGTLVILDSPMYRDPSSGARMVEERRTRFVARYGFPSDAFASEHFLTPGRLAALADELRLAWQIHKPSLDWRSRVGRTIGGVRARREPASFPVIVGMRT